MKFVSYFLLCHFLWSGVVHAQCGHGLSLSSQYLNRMKETNVNNFVVSTECAYLDTILYISCAHNFCFYSCFDSFMVYVMFSHQRIIKESLQNSFHLNKQVLISPISAQTVKPATLDLSSSTMMEPTEMTLQMMECTHVIVSTIVNPTLISAICTDLLCIIMLQAHI